MSYATPEPGRYRRIKDNAEVYVFACTGSSAMDTVAVRPATKGGRISHVRLENFWKKYAVLPVGAPTSPTERS